jgi:hypothetical protein
MIVPSRIPDRNPPTCRVSGLLLWFVLMSASIGYSAPPEIDANASAPATDTEAGISLLAQVEDGTFSFDDEGFYWFCRYLRATKSALNDTSCDDADVVPWQYLMERPSDYRGRIVCIEGRFLREQPAYEIPSRPEIGRLRQVDLGVPGSNAIATIVLVDAAPTTRKRALIRTRGFFIKVRAFQSASGAEGAGPLFVARSFEVLEAPAGGAASSGPIEGRHLLTGMAAMVVFLFVLTVAVRRRVGNAKGGESATFERPRVTGTGRDFDWLNESSADRSGSGDQLP